MASSLIPSDNPSVFDGLSPSTLQALAYPSPLPLGIAGLIFDWIGDERIELRSDITDSWVENNTVINDQIALHPERFTVDASTAEVVFSPTVPNPAPPQPANPLPLNEPFVPVLTPGAQQAADANAAQASTTSAGTNSLYGYYLSKQGGSLTKQERVMGYIYQLWLGRCRFTVETPWGIFKDMVIEMADGVQTEETNGRTDHKITFKKFRIAQEVTVTEVQFSGRAFPQATESDPSLNGNIGQLDVTSRGTAQILGNWRAATQ